MPAAAQPLRDRSVMVTGGLGFIGRHLVRAALSAGARRVRVLDRASAVGRELPAGAEAFRFELGSDPAAGLEPALDGIELLFHFAAEKHSQARPVPERMLAANVSGSYDLFAAASRAGVRKVVFASSVFAYGRTSGPPLDEAEPPRPTTVYGVSKLAGEHLLDHAAAELGLPGVALRYFFVYGPGQDAGRGYRSVVVRSLDRLRDGLPPTVYGDGSQALDYVYVDDAVDAALRAMEGDVAGAVVNVGSGRATPVRELIAALTRTAGAAVEPEHLPPDATAGSFRVARIERARECLGWAPTTPLDEGLRRTWAWHQAAPAE
jgi:UDP-glucose 4-epimerase